MYACTHTHSCMCISIHESPALSARVTTEKFILTVLNTQTDPYRKSIHVYSYFFLLKNPKYFSPVFYILLNVWNISALHLKKCNLSMCQLDFMERLNCEVVIRSNMNVFDLYLSHLLFFGVFCKISWCQKDELFKSNSQIKKHICSHSL